MGKRDTGEIKVSSPLKSKTSRGKNIISRAGLKVGKKVEDEKKKKVEDEKKKKVAKEAKAKEAKAKEAKAKEAKVKEEKSKNVGNEIKVEAELKEVDKILGEGRRQVETFKKKDLNSFSLEEIKEGDLNFYLNPNKDEVFGDGVNVIQVGEDHELFRIILNKLNKKDGRFLRFKTLKYDSILAKVFSRIWRDCSWFEEFPEVHVRRFGSCMVVLDMMESIRDKNYFVLAEIYEVGEKYKIRNFTFASFNIIFM